MVSLWYPLVFGAWKKCLIYFSHTHTYSMIYPDSEQTMSAMSRYPSASTSLWQASHRPSGRDNVLDRSSPTMHPSADGKSLGIVPGHWGLHLGPGVLKGGKAQGDPSIRCCAHSDVCWFVNHSNYTYIMYILVFPKIGVPPVIIHFNGIFPYNHPFGGIPILWKPPYILELWSNLATIVIALLQHSMIRKLTRDNYMKSYKMVPPPQF